jgi:non-specific serine/threonine protein kinase
VTLTGAGGVGKTRLALEIATELLRVGAAGDPSGAPFPDGAWLVELAPLGDPRRLPQAVAAVFGLQEEPGRGYAEVLQDALRPRRLLLVLDNCEHLVQASAELAHALLRACPGVSVLATSREPLGIAGETTRRVPSLACPDARSLPTPERVRGYEAARLFVERAAAAGGDFGLSARNAAAVAQICERLDGIPLALELAAARTRALSVEQIAARLDDRFRLLAEGSRTAPPRQQTLEAAVAWSYDLLGEDERRLFRRLSVFSGGWTLEAAEAICADPGPAASGDVLDLLARLVDKSLVLAEPGPGGAKWYRLLETIRQFTADRLRAAGEDRPIRERHFEWYVGLAEEADRVVRWAPNLPWPARQEWQVRLGWEHGNLRAAYQWAMDGDGDDVRAGLRMGAALYAFFYATGYLSEGREWLAGLLARDRAAPPSRARARALSVAAKLAAHHGDDAAGQALAEEYLALPEALQEPAVTGIALNALSIAALRQGNLRVARDYVTAALSLARGSPEAGTSLYLPYLAAVAEAEGRLDEAQRVYEAALSEGRAADFRVTVGLALDGLARIAHARGERERARRLYEEALGALREIGAMPQSALLLVALGHLALEDRDVTQARARFGEGLDLATVLGYRESLVAALEGVAALHMAVAPRHGLSVDPALRLLGAAAGLREGPRLHPPAEAARAALAQARGTVGEERADALLAEGRILGPDGAAQAARGALQALARHTPRLPDAATPTLTPREREVAALLARGYSNPQIAEALVIGKRTAEMHVSHLLAKLGLASRAQVAVWAVERGFLEDDDAPPV